MDSCKPFYGGLRQRTLFTFKLSNLLVGNIFGSMRRNVGHFSYKIRTF